MALPTIAVGALGGTIVSRPADGTGVVPQLGAADLVSGVPELGAIARIRAETLAMLPSPSLDEPTIMDALRWAQVAVADGARGVVLTQGTDTLEEAAYLLDLFWDRPEPLVVTGAMRSAGAPGADGPANLLTAVRAAVAPGSRDRGVLVAMNDEIHHARWVAKTDSLSTGAFRSPSFGPIGRCVEASVVYGAPAGRVTALQPAAGQAAKNPRVLLIATHLGDDAYLLDAIQPDDVDGLVIAGFGAGHVPVAVADAVSRLADEVPVVFASRTGAGPTGRAIYGYPGSEVDLLARGAVGAGWLPPAKARLLLWALASRGPLTRAEVAAAFEVRGRA